MEKIENIKKIEIATNTIVYMYPLDGEVLIALVSGKDYHAVGPLNFDRRNATVSFIIKEN